MKPIKLEMCNFGCFYGTKIIDFNKLYKNPLYLISGDTGSGKTTIFDAVMYALYGERSGTDRKDAGIRSDFASSDEDTYVILEFEINGEIYSIKRIPSYIRKKNKTASPANALLDLPDGSKVSGVKAVDAKIQELIGLTTEQFRQVIMLSQGEFVKLIKASSMERDVIFRKIFNTYIYNDIKEQIKIRYDEKKEELNLEEGIIQNEIVKISKYDFASLPLVKDLHNLPSLSNDIDDLIKDKEKEQKELKKELTTLDKEIKSLISEISTANSLNNDIDKLTNANNKIIELDNKKKEYQELEDYLKKLNAANVIKDSYIKNNSNKTSLDNNNEELKAKKAELDLKENELNSYKEQESMIELDRSGLNETKKQLDVINSDISHLENIEANKQLLDKANDKYKEVENKIANKNNLINNKKAEISDIDKYLEEENKYLLHQQEIKQKLDDLEEEEKALKLIQEDLNKLKLLKKELELKDDDYKTALSKEQLLKQKQAEAECLYYNNSVGIVLSRLKENEPCPICGSLSHPHIAKLEQGITKEELDDINSKLKDATDEKTSAFELLSNKTSEYQVKEQSLLSSLDISDISKADALILAKFESNQVNTNKFSENAKNDELWLKTANNKKTLKSKLQNEINTLDDELVLDNKELTDINNEIIRLKSAIDIDQKALQSTFDIPKLKLLKEEKEYFIEEVGAVLAGFDEGYDKAKLEFQNVNGEYTALKNQNDNLIKLFEKSNNDYNSLLDESILKDDPDLDDLISSTNKISNITTDLNNYHNDYKLNKDIINELSDKLKGKEKVDITTLKDNQTLKEQKQSDISKIDNSLNIEINSLKDSNTFFNEHFKIYDKLFDEVEEYNDLNNLIKGSNHKHITFERYILIDYFDKILAYTNIRLKKMSYGQFELIRREETSGAGQQGLDIDVMDYNTGKAREVNTLSGGEMFKAALSLALGLADAIQDANASVEINSLFIDEGFGTLDSNSLNVAVGILEDLSNGNKNIGIISHVQELKEIIPNQVIVTKTAKGSEIKIK